MQKYLKIKCGPRQRADDPKTAGKQRSDPLCWDVRNRGYRNKGPGREVVSRGDPSKAFVTRRETIKKTMRGLLMISQIETGDVKPDENEKHTRKLS
jgi:hypothetical protein